MEFLKQKPNVGRTDGHMYLIHGEIYRENGKHPNTFITCKYLNTLKRQI